MKLFHFIREWMKAQKFVLLKGYSVTLLVLFYLQQNYLMPSVKNVQKNVKVTKLGGETNFFLKTAGRLTHFIEEIQTQFDPECSLSDYDVIKMKNFKRHALEFFRFYADFNYEQVISTFLGRDVSKRYYRSVYPDNHR